MVGIDIGQDFRLEATAKSNERSGSEKMPSFSLRSFFPTELWDMTTPWPRQTPVFFIVTMDGSPLLSD